MEDYSDIRPFLDDEIRPAFNELLHDRQFTHMLRGFVPWCPIGIMRSLLKLPMIGVKTGLDWQKHYMLPVMTILIKRATHGCSIDIPADFDRKGSKTFVSNHRDIVLDSALLDVLLVRNGIDKTVQIAIGDNLLIYPWIKNLVRLNKAFIVRRSLGLKEMLRSSQLMSDYMHHVIREGRDHIWIAQREGRAKDSSDHTQESVLKMMAMGGEGNYVECLKSLNVTPLTITYEFDPCDYLKAKEFQLKRDNPSYKKTKKDDLDNMRVGIMGQKGHVDYVIAPCINTWLDEIADLPKAEFFAEVCRRMDKAIHSGYKLYPANYVAADLLSGENIYADKYTDKDRRDFEAYIDSRIKLVDIPNPDVPFLRERLLTMYANPVANYIRATND